MRKNDLYINILIIVMVLAAIGLLFTSFFIDPIGVVAPIAIIFNGIIFAMVTLIKNTCYEKEQ